jgi:fatty acid-binding protein DegV
MILCDEAVRFTAAEQLSPHFMQVTDFAETMEQLEEDLYVVTAASSGAYQAALAAQEALLTMYPERHIAVFAAPYSGELAVARRLHDFLLQGLEPEEVQLATEDYLRQLSTLGVLGRTDVPEKKGLSSLLRSRFGGKLLLEGRKNGRVRIRGGNSMEKALELAKKRYAARPEKPSRCVITYAGCPERAKELGRRLREACGFRELVIVPASNTVTRYMGSNTWMAAF